MPYLANRLPGERQRALIALKLLTTQRLNYVDAFTRALYGASFQQFSGQFKSVKISALLNATEYHSNPWNILNEANQIVCNGRWDFSQQLERIASKCETSFLVTEELSARTNLRNFMLASAEAEIGRRGLLTQLALIAYRLDHDSYPETLEELMPEYLPWVILDPYSQQPFEYRPEGLDLPLYDKIAADTPLLWSIGNDNRTLREKERYYDEEGQPLETEADRKQHNVQRQYEFTPYSYWNAHSNQVFALPK